MKQVKILEVNLIISKDILRKLYLYIKEIGQGCFGKVYKARRNGEIVAAKELELTDKNENEIDNEINQLIKLKHENIVRYIDHFFQRDGSTLFCYIFMEFMEGR